MTISEMNGVQWDGAIEIVTNTTPVVEVSPQPLSSLVSKVEGLWVDVPLGTPCCPKKREVEVLTFDSDDELSPNNQETALPHKLTYDPDLGFDLVVLIRKPESSK